MCKNGGFPEKNQKTPSNFIFYPKVCYHLPCYSTGNLKKLGKDVLYKVIEKNGLYCLLLMVYFCPSSLYGYFEALRAKMYPYILGRAEIYHK